MVASALAAVLDTRDTKLDLYNHDLQEYEIKALPLIAHA